MSEPPEIALAILQFAALLFERAITFVVAKTEVIAEKSIGISTVKQDDPSAPLMFRIPLADHSVLQHVVATGRFYYGIRSDTVLTDLLHEQIGAPRSSKFVLVPLVSRGNVIAVTYADFGDKPVSPVQVSLIEALSKYAGSILDNAMYRKSLEKAV
jgi:hypothetical protein